MKIGLIGCEFSSPNKGCEALTYSIISILDEINKLDNNTVIYNFSDTKLGYIPNIFNKFTFKNIKPKLKDRKFKYIKALKECNIILDATMGDSFSDIYSEKYYNKLIKHKRIAEILCKNYILLPQTYGPFNSRKSEKKAKKVLYKAKKIFCRDSESQKYIDEKLNIKNSILTTDMAFLLPYDKEIYNIKDNKKTKIGVNISGLLYKGGFISNNQFDLHLDYKKFIDKLLEYLTTEKKYEIHLIPHVVDKNINAHDDDYNICKELSIKYKECILAPAFETPIEAKSYIANMNIFIGSRMHSTIAAFSSNVVTIPVSYSRKFEGLYNSLNYPYLINGRSLTTENAIEEVIEYINNTEELKKVQQESLKIIKDKTDILIMNIKDIFQN